MFTGRSPVSGVFLRGANSETGHKEFYLYLVQSDLALTVIFYSYLNRKALLMKCPGRWHPAEAERFGHLSAPSRDVILTSFHVSWVQKKIHLAAFDSI
jgi:hypothetical protein